MKAFSLARIVPPKQRIMSRYMNLTPLFDWGVKMLKLLENNVLTNEEAEKVSFLKQYKSFVFQTCNLLRALNKIQQMMKMEGFCAETVAKVKTLLSDFQDDNGLKVCKLIVDK